MREGMKVSVRDEIRLSARDGTKVSDDGRKAVLASGIGHFMEWFEFATYGYLAVVFSKNFFQFSSSENMSLLLSFATFGVGFVARPLGGILFGQLGNRLGRRSLLVVTIWILAIATFAIGCLPTYDKIGILAPILLVLLRLVQGFSLGGEWAAAAMYMIEWAPQSKRGFYGSLLQFSGTLGLMLGSLMVAILTSVIGSEALSAWGWRIPFLLAAAIGPVAVAIRRRIGETPAFEKMKAQRAAGGLPPDGVIQSSKMKNSAVTFCFTATWSVLFYFVLSFMPAFLQRQVKLPASDAFWLGTIGLVAFAILTPIMGALSDRVGRRPVLFVGCLTFAGFAYFLLSYLLTGVSLTGVLMVELALAFMLSLFSGPGTAAVTEIFPTELRSGWMSVIYSLSVAIFGGFSPFVATWLIGATGLPLAPTFLVIGFAMVGGVTVMEIGRAHV